LGWLAALADPPTGAALQLMHEQIARRWTGDHAQGLDQYDLRDMVGDERRRSAARAFHGLASRSPPQHRRGVAA